MGLLVGDLGCQNDPDSKVTTDPGLLDMALYAPALLQIWDPHPCQFFLAPAVGLNG